MEMPKLAAARDCDVEASMAAYFASRGSADAAYGLSTLVSTMFQRTAEAAWPSMLTLGRRLEAGESMRSGNWTFEAVRTGDPWNVAFVAEDESGCGFLYVLDLEKERSEARKAEVSARVEEARRIEDPEARRAAVAKALIDDILADEEAVAVGSDYKDPSEVSAVDKVRAYAYRGCEPASFYDGYSMTLPNLLDRIGGKEYAHGGIAECRPTKAVSGLEPRGTTERCPQTAAVLSALGVLGSGLETAGLMGDVRARGGTIERWRYPNYGDEDNGKVIEAAQGAVCADSGFAGPTCADIAWDFWRSAVETDLSSRSAALGEVVAMLREAGHVSTETRYDCNDMDDFAHVVMDGRDGFGTLWMRTQNGEYGIRFRQTSDALDHVVLARVSSGFGTTPLGIGEDEPGFLGAFTPATKPPGGGVAPMVARKMGRFHDRTIRDINNILLTLDTIHCCLQAEMKANRTNPGP